MQKVCLMRLNEDNGLADMKKTLIFLSFLRI